MLKLFEDGQYDFGLGWSSFESFVTEAVPTATAAPEYLWKRFDPGRSGLVNVLEVMVGLTVMCVGRFRDKIDLVFDICNLQHKDELAYDEVVVLMFLTVGATVLLSGKGETPPESAMEAFTDDAFVTANKDISEGLSREDLHAWFAEAFRIELDDRAVSITVRNFLRHFHAMPKAKQKAPHPNAVEYQQAAMLDGAAGRLAAAPTGDSLALR